MMLVHHTSHPVKTEAVELVHIHPVAKIAHQETQYFMVSVIEETTVPKLVSTSGSFVEVMVVAPIKMIQAIKDVFAGMRMNDIE